MAQDVQEYSRLLDVTLALFTGIVIAAVSSWITVQLSLRRFRTERWWEPKAEAYERIISALHDSKVYLEEHFHAVVAYEDGPKDAKELSARMKAANAAIGKAINTGRSFSRLRRWQD